jgi:PiT family inorganic phosphate transporter
MTVTWILSPLIALFGAMIILKIIRRLLRFYADGLLGEMRIARLSAIPLLLCSGIFAFSAGANDIGKASAFLSVIYGDSFLVRVIVGLGLLVGSLTLGRRVTRSIGLKLVRLDPVMALSAETTMALIMFFGTILGLPLSGTHILVGAVIGVASVRGRWINIKGLKQIIFSWLATFFIATLICVVVFFVARTIFS